MTLKTIIICIAIIFFIRIVYKFFLPIFGIYRTAKKAMNEMKNHQNRHFDNYNAQQNPQNNQQSTQSSKGPVEGEYIDYEEVSK